jgi:dTDP-4-dehydrorhamnose 3,5-epimerase
MKFHETRVHGVFEINLEPISDERGFFARSWCQKEFEARGLNANLVQCNVSFSVKKGTLRGMHCQAVVDLRPNSPTFKRWTAAVLTSANRHMLYVPEGCGHGFLTLEDGVEVFYQMSQFYNPQAARGVRWDDPAFGIVWPEEVKVISERDRTYPNFER